MSREEGCRSIDLLGSSIHRRGSWRHERLVWKIRHRLVSILRRGAGSVPRAVALRKRRCVSGVF